MFRKTIPQKEQAQYACIESCIKEELTAVDQIKQELSRITSPVQGDFANDDGVPDFDQQSPRDIGFNNYQRPKFDPPKSISQNRMSNGNKPRQSDRQPTSARRDRVSGRDYDRPWMQNQSKPAKN